MKATFTALQSSRLHLELCPSVGGCITRLDFINNGAVIPVLRPYDTALPLSPLNFANFPLTPFSNRIDHGKLQFQGMTFDVGPAFASEPHPNHGDGWTSPWAVESQTDDSVTLILKTKSSPLTPYVYEARQIFRLKDDSMIADIEMTNLSGRPLPFGTGHHFYYPRTQQTVLKARLPQVWTCRDVMMPKDLIDVPAQWDFSKGITISDDNLKPAIHGGDGTALMDHCFQGWDQHAEIYWPETGTCLTIDADPVFKNFVIYVPQNNFFCAEPVTNITNGFNLMEQGVKKTGTVILNHGQTLSGQVRLKASQRQFTPS